MLSLFIITISMIFVLKGQHLFGNSIDWFNQHVMLSDALRQAIRDEGTLFPTYLKNLMSGVNIYYFSYYGYLRPDVLLGALFINIKMIDQGSSELNIIVGVKNIHFNEAIRAIYNTFIEQE